MRGVGGVAEYYDHPCQYSALQSGVSDLRQLEGHVWIARMTRASIALPSVLGWDVLQHFRIDIEYASRRVRLLEPGEA